MNKRKMQILSGDFPNDADKDEDCGEAEGVFETLNTGTKSSTTIAQDMEASTTTESFQAVVRCSVPAQGAESCGLTQINVAGISSVEPHVAIRRQLPNEEARRWRNIRCSGMVFARRV